MGAAISSNVSNQIIDTSIGIGNTYAQNCTSKGTQKFNLSIANGCKSNIGQININDQQYVDISCIQNTTTKNSMQADIQSQILQQITAAAQSIGLPSLTLASDVENFAQKTALDISNLYTQSCVQTLNQSQQITCTDPGSELTVGLINIQDAQNSYSNCVANNTTINDAKLTLKNFFDTQTNAKEADTAATFVIIGLIVLTFVGIFFLYTLNGPLGWVVVGIFLLIVIAIIVYATVAFTDKLYPFNQKTSVS